MPDLPPVPCSSPSAVCVDTSERFLQCPQVVHRDIERALCVLMLVAWSACAQTPGFEGQKIIDIQYSQPSLLVQSDLDRVQPLRKGEPLRAEDVARAVDGMF